MKQFRVASILAATALACGLGFMTPAAAQPDVNNAPQADNPAEAQPRTRLEQMQRRQAQQRQMRNTMLRQGLTMLGFAEPEMHDALEAHFTGRDTLEDTLLQYQLEVAQALGNPDDAEIATLLTEYNEAIEKYTEMRRASEEALEAQITYSQHPKLELVLRLSGAVGDHSNLNQLMLLMGGAGGMQQ